jgi:DNA-directed RNA polymerase I and III subunit RPAC1
LNIAATASYRLHPLIILSPTNPVPPHLAEKFAKCFPRGIINIDPVTKAVSVNEKEVRRDPVSREVLRHLEFQDCVQLGRIRDHFLCEPFSPITSWLSNLIDPVNIESEGPYEPEQLLPESIKVMRDKIAVLKRAAMALVDGGQGDGDVEMTAP